MDNMTVTEEWETSILATKTKVHHRNALKYFEEFLKKNPEEMLELRSKEGKRFITRIVQFYQWLQNKKSLSSNTSRSYIIGLQSFFAYYDLPLKLKNKLPKMHMKIERYRPSLEDLQKLYRFSDLQTKAWLSLSRDVPGRMSDLLRITHEQIEQGEFMLLSGKENVIGKCYVTEATRELFKQCSASGIELPKTGRGINIMLERACKVAGISKINQHLLRKVWISKAIDLGLSEIVIKVLTFKSVDESMLTYWLNRTELRDHWKKVVGALPLEATRVYVRLPSIEEAVELVMEVQKQELLGKVKKLWSEKHGKYTSTGSGEILGLMLTQPDFEKMTPKELLKKYLELLKET